jgi:hypothetical protein
LKLPKCTDLDFLIFILREAFSPKYFNSLNFFLSHTVIALQKIHSLQLSEIQNAQFLNRWISLNRSQISISLWSRSRNSEIVLWTLLNRAQNFNLTLYSQFNFSYSLWFFRRVTKFNQSSQIGEFVNPNQHRSSPISMYEFNQACKSFIFF